MIKTTIFLLIGVLFLGCKQKPVDTSTQNNPFTKSRPNTHILGQILNPQSDFAVLSIGSFHDTVKLDEQSRVSFNLYLAKANYFKISDGKSNFKIFISPGDELSISYNANNLFNTIKFSGTGAEPNNYIKEKHLLMLDNPIPLEHLYEMPAKEFRHLIDSFYVISKMYFEEFVISNPSVSQDFKETELASLTYNRASRLMEYLNTTSHLHEINEPNYLKFLEQLSVNEQNMLDVYEYKLFLSAYIDYYAGKKYKTENFTPAEITLIKLQTISAHIKNQDVKDYLMFTFLRDHVKYYGYKDTDLLFKTFEFQCKNEQMRQGILPPYYEYIKLTLKQKAPEFSMIDAAGNKFSIADFNGRYIYIDVWATWCMPCRKESPYFEAFKIKYKDKNVEFVSVSIDKKPEEWLEFLVLKNLKQNHFLATDVQLFLDAYMIKTIPHFLIIDDKGNLIDNDASRPSENNTKWIDELPDKAAV